MKNNNKKYLMLLIFFVSILVMSIGYSAWIIINVKEDDSLPTYNYHQIIENAYKDQDKDYNKNSQGPDPTTNIDVDGLSFKYRKVGESTWTAGLPTNSGDYEIWIINSYDESSSTFGTDSIVINFTINKIDPILTTSDVDLFLSDIQGVDMKETIKNYYTYDGDGDLIDIVFDTQDGSQPTTTGEYIATISYNEGQNYNAISKEINISIINSVALDKTHISEISTVEYTGSQITPEPIVTVKGITLIKDQDYTLSYGTNLNVGGGSVTITAKGDNYTGSVTVPFTITWKVLTPQELAVNFNETYRTYEGIRDNQIITGLILKDSDEKEFAATSIANVKYMHDGNYGYGTLPEGSNYSTTTNVVGSTYYVSIELINNNYKLSQDYFILKYQTVNIGGAGYYTIEDAIASSTSGTISLYGSSSTDTSYLETSFTSLSSAYTPYNNGIKSFDVYKQMIVPYDANNTIPNANGTGVTDAGTCKGNVYSVLNIPNGITFNLKSGGSIIVSALLDYNMSKGTTFATTRGIIMNSGTINLESGSSLITYGYTKGTGTINMASGSSLTDCITIYDFPGGTAAVQVWNPLGDKHFPMKSWSMHHNSCKTVINAGSTYMSTTYMNLSGEVVLDDFNVIASSGNYLFKINSGKMIKTTTGADNGTGSAELVSITGSNQILGQKDVYYIEGEVFDGKLAVPIKILISTTLEANTDRIIGIGFMELHLKDKSNLTISQSSYAFLPGTYIEIEKGATMTIESNSKFAFIDSDELTNISFSCIDKTDAYIKVNGTLNVKGYISGDIRTSEEGAILNITGTPSTSFKLFTSSSNVGSFGYSATGLVYNSPIGYSSMYLSKTTYYSSGEAWCSTSSGTITYDSMGGSVIDSQTVTIINGTTIGYNLTDLPEPTRIGYTFEGWYFDKTYENSADDVQIYNSVTLYAKWSVLQFTITFDTDGGSTIPSITQNYGTTVTAPNDPSKDGFNFAGWDKEIPETMPAENITITAKWKSIEIVTYTITFISNGNTYQIIVDEAGVEITPPNDPSRTGYTFTGWDKEIPSTMPAENMTITATWQINQYTITFNTNGGSTINSITQDYGTAITAPVNPTRTGYTFAGWNQEIPTTMPAENITITAEWTIIYYTVTFNGNGGTVSGQSSFSIPYNTSFSDNGYSLPSASKSDGGIIADRLKGWYTKTSGGTKFTTSTIVTSDITLYAQWENECIVEGTLITMADGTKKPVEELKTGDQVLVFNHETGMLDISILQSLIHNNDSKINVNVINLYFSNGTELRIVGAHGLFDLNELKYVFIDEQNVNNYIGHRFYATYLVDNQIIEESVILEDYKITNENVRVYSPITVYYLNCISNDMLSMTTNHFDNQDALVNVFEYDDDLSYKKDLMQMDIEQYGLFSYEELSEYMSYEEYTYSSIKYAKISIGKGYTTFEELLIILKEFRQEVEENS